MNSIRLCIKNCTPSWPFHKELANLDPGEGGGAGVGVGGGSIYQATPMLGRVCSLQMQSWSFNFNSFCHDTKGKKMREKIYSPLSESQMRKPSSTY